MRLKVFQRKPIRDGGDTHRRALQPPRSFTRPAPIPHRAATVQPNRARGRVAPRGHHFGDIAVQGHKPSAGSGDGAGLPDDLKAGVERLAGVPLDDVLVKYNSPRPARLRARAFTQGSEIHIGPGQEKHLAHEAWHVVQQKQGRVPRTEQLRGVAVNTDRALEHEAEQMGARATQGVGGWSGRHVSPVGHAPFGLTPPIQMNGDDSEDEQSDEERPRKKQKAEKTKDTEEPKFSGFEDLLGIKGAKQQGMISTVQGKQYAGPISMVGKRHEQVKRQIANLVLNRLTKEQVDQAKERAKDQPSTQKRKRAPTKKDSPSKSKKQETETQKKPKKAALKVDKPVEIQTRMVGKRLILNSNDPRASVALHENLVKSGGLFDYIKGKDALVPSMDKDTARPKRYVSKLKKAVKQERHWQKTPKVGEKNDDISKANTILTALQDKNVGLFEPDDKEKLNAELEKWKKDTAPLVYVLKHSESDLDKEHAERVQTKFTTTHLKEFESDTSTRPVGPKTPCFGCDVFHKVNYPNLADQGPYSGAYFQKSSPISTEKEKEKALEQVKLRPSTGSISQEGYQRNSDYPDSDSDEEGSEVFPRPKGFTVPFSEKNPTKQTWLTESGERSFRANLKRNRIVTELDKEKDKEKDKKKRKNK